MSITSLSNANKEKMQELEDELATSLRDLIAGRDELDMITFTEDEVTNLTAICSRLCVLGGHQDITRWADEDEGGKQSSIWSIVSALVERGRLGYKDEEMASHAFADVERCSDYLYFPQMILSALRFMNLHIMWKTRIIKDEGSPQARDSAYRETFLQERSALVAKITEFAFGTRSNTAEGVKDEVKSS
jgi:cohesin complex subunit SA-1/2